MSKVATATALGMLSYGLFSVSSARAADLAEAISGGQPKVDVRLRYESVDQDGKAEKASAITNRTRIGYETGAYVGVKAFFEMENITAISDSYDPDPSAAIGDAKYPLVADPEGTEVNQVFISYMPAEGSSITAGRQRIIVDESRFVGNVGWRQNEQTFDAFRIVSKALPDTLVDYAYVTGVNGILGGATVDMKSHLLTVAYSGLPFGKLTAYTYALDFDAGTDSQTTGLNVAGATELSGVKALYRVEYATMGDYADNSSGGDASYTMLELGAVVSGITAKFGYEVLGSDGVTKFDTPLATKHKFNGWADKFLASTPTDGLVDTYVSAGTKVGMVNLLGVYHTFAADNGGADLGSELDLSAATKFAKIFNGGVKYASYTAGDTGVDTSKLWAWVGASF